MARPRLPIRAEQVAELARRGWSVAEMAAFFACDRGTLYKRFSAELAGVRACRAEQARERFERSRREAEAASHDRSMISILRHLRGIP